MKKHLSFLLVVCMMLTLCVPALATGDLEHHILVIPSADTLGTSKKLTLADTLASLTR